MSPQELSKLKDLLAVAVNLPMSVESDALVFGLSELCDASRPTGHEADVPSFAEYEHHIDN